MSASTGVELGSISAASDLEASAFPEGTLGAYRGAIAALTKAAAQRKPTKQDVDRARSAGAGQAGACGAAEKKVRLGEKGLVACAFGFATCDEGKAAEFGQTSDQARAAAETAWRKLVMIPVDDANASDIAARMKEAECVAPWW